MNSSTRSYIEGESSVNQRLNLLVDTFEKGKKAPFARKIGVSAQAVQEMLMGRKSDPSFKVLVRILEEYPSVSSDWLVLGQGQMLRDTSPPAASQVVEVVQLIQEYVQVSKHLEHGRAMHRESAKALARLRAEVEHQEAALQVQMEHLPNFDPEAQKVLQTVIQQQQETLAKAQKRYAEFMPFLEQVEEELLNVLKRQGKLEKDLAEFMGSVVPLNMEEQMKAISLRNKLVQTVNSPPPKKHL
ncbi:helix-turn-helix domain-containing protein [Hymenobacter sp. BT664]|uniref:Helix-turn-helix domain-containing protein n=1 Tax=Hymenobacter montanus TaxID=2771359 RepID=A0A927BGJ6_9BACT|nr:helix-turn-helix domain-containing protein [Hymenobacter montanus]MBD2769668.1 helix-turn-helix domain-containing protein [Hymenobacter montanus]